MTELQFQHSLQVLLTDHVMGILTIDEYTKAVNDLVKKRQEHASKAKGHLELFMYRVDRMRKVQIEYFAGNRNKLAEAKILENAVDYASAKIKALGYSTEHIDEKKDNQAKMF